jgi:RNA polymerase sigma-70 factor (ECF subfamily)
VLPDDHPVDNQPGIPRSDELPAATNTTSTGPAQPTDGELIRRAKRGESAAFHAIVDRYAHRLFGLAYSLLGDASDAEDVVQETLAGAYRGLARFEERAALWTWLTRILVRQAARHRRSWRTQRSPISLDAAHAKDEEAVRTASMPATGGVDVQVDLHAALQTLSADHRDVIVLRELQQMSYEEMASALGVPRGTVESRLHRARAELKRRLAAYLP